MITLSMDKKFGIFSTINGGLQPNPYTIHSLLHTYIMDMLMDTQPWLDTHMGWACTEPEARVSYDDDSVNGSI